MVDYVARFHRVHETFGSSLSKCPKIPGIEEDTYEFQTKSDNVAIGKVMKHEKELIMKGCDMAYSILNSFVREDGESLLERYQETDESERRVLCIDF